MTTEPIYRVPEIVTDSGRVVSGRFPGRAALSLLPFSSLVVDDFSGILSVARMGSGALPGPRRIPTLLGDPKP